ncbi:MAG: Gldg family protein [Planctomycetota bacterium]|nr:Gldg family protein [Planctomycetota bacterium]
MALNGASGERAPRPAGVTRLVKAARLAGTLACLGLSVNVFVCVVRDRFADARALAPFAVFAPLLLASAWICREEFKASLRGPRMRVAAHVLVQALLGFIVLGAVLYAFGFRFHARFDLSTDAVYELHEETLGRLAGLKDLAEPVEAVVLAGEPAADPNERREVERLRAELNALLERYKRHADELAPGRFGFSTLNMLAEPSRLERLGKRLGLATFTPEMSESVVLLCGERARLLTKRDFFVVNRTPEGVSLGARFHGEAALTAGLRLLLNPAARAVYVAHGHGERTVAELTGFVEALRKQNYDVRGLDLAAAPRVPDDASALVLCGPRETYRPAAVAALQAYLERGGRLFLLVDPVQPALSEMPRAETGLGDLLQGYGIRLRQDLATRGVRPAVLGEPLPLEQLVALPASRALLLRPLAEARAPVYFERPCAVEGLKPPEGREVAKLLESPPYQTREALYWADPVKLAAPRHEAGAESLQGPVPLALCAGPVKSAEGAETQGARIVVAAESRILADAQFMQYMGNHLFALASVRWLAGGEDAGASIPPRSPKIRMAQLEEREAEVLMLLLVIILPALLIFVGVVVWASRRT